MRRISRRTTATAVLVTGATLLTASLTPAHAGTGLVYQAVDADNDPYSGIYLRDGTSMSNVRRITERYMYYGNSFELICGMNGEAVGPYNNRRWHKVTVLNGPASGQVGWIADRYANTPNAANQPTPGEPECDANGNPPAPAPPATYDGSVYFESNGAGDESSPASVHRAFNHWTSTTTCSGANANTFPSWLAPNNKYITTAAGWSIGRLGPVYMLEATQNNSGSGRWQEVDYILLFDPGNYADLVGNACDTQNNRGQLYTKWLKANPNAKLVVLAGARTGESSHRGIQTLYFDYLRANAGPRDRVLVCNYDGMAHQAVYSNFKNAMTSPPTLPLDQNDCPGTESWAWHP